mmetsp:Transcript_26452/g.55260  ORF Transcript_26452/g.55260 Transcript_26452/m.55260 type:complete len:226 (-) Transcript_26452:171-848(-)
MVARSSAAVVASAEDDAVGAFNLLPPKSLITLCSATLRSATELAFFLLRCIAASWRLRFSARRAARLLTRAGADVSIAAALLALAPSPDMVSDVIPAAALFSAILACSFARSISMREAYDPLLLATPPSFFSGWGVAVAALPSSFSSSPSPSDISIALPSSSSLSLSSISFFNLFLASSVVSIFSGSNFSFFAILFLAFRASFDSLCCPFRYLGLYTSSPDAPAM